MTCVLVVRKTRMVGKAVGSDFEECPAKEFFLKDPTAWPSVSKRLSLERRMRKSFALWIFWLGNISYSTAICGIRNDNGVGIRVAGSLPTHFGEWPHVCSILRFLEIFSSTRFPFQLNAPGTLDYKTILGNQCWILSVWHHFWYNLF